MAANVGKTDVTSVAVGSSTTNWGGNNAGGKAKAKGKAARPNQPVGVSGGGGGSRKLPSGTYKA